VNRLRIAHVSDVHIRTLKWHAEYRRALRSFYADLLEAKPDLIVCAGDLVHSKTTMSPELVSMLSEHVRAVAQVAPYLIIIGNHDANIANPDREDAISPVVNSLGVDAHVFRDSGLSWESSKPGLPTVKLWTFSCLDTKRFPTAEQLSDDDVNVAIVHGRISGCVAENGMPLDFEHDVSIFDGFDAVIAGDVHKTQAVKKNVVYAGSLIQQNHGETRDKGYLTWDVMSKDEIVVERRLVSGFGGFFTVDLTDTGLPDALVPSDAYLRVVARRRVSSLERRGLESAAREKYGVKHVSVTVFDDSSQSDPQSIVGDIDHRALIAQHVESEGHSSDVVKRALEIDEAVEKEAVDSDARGSSWQLEAFGWNDLFAFGKGNVVDLTKPRGIVGVFGPNATGKSSIFEVLLECLFDKTSKPIERNIEMINDHADIGSTIATFRANGERYSVERSIEKVKRVGEKELAKTSLSFHSLDGADKKTCLNGQTRQETEKHVRNVVGSFIDFALSSISAQTYVSGVPGGGNVVRCKDSDRSKIFARFIGLDVFEAKFSAAKELQKKQRADVERFSGDLDTQITVAAGCVSASEASIDDVGGKLKAAQETLIDVESELAAARTQVDDAALKASIRLEVLSTQLDAVESELERASDAHAAALQRSEEIGAIVQAREVDVAACDSVSIANEMFVLEGAKKRASEAESTAAFASKKLAVISEIAAAAKLAPCNGAFPTCPFVAGSLSAMKEELDLSATIERCVASLESANAEVDQLGHVVVKKRQLDSAVVMLETVKAKRRSVAADEAASHAALDSAAASVRSIKQQKKVAEESPATVDERAVKMVATLEEKSRSAKTLVSSLEKALAGYNKSLGMHSERLSALRLEVEKRVSARFELEALDAYVDAVGKHGVPKTILARKLPAVNDEISQVLSGIADFSVAVEVSSDQTIAISIDNGERKRDVALASGAQEFIASLGVRIALLNVSSLPKPNFFIVDEGFGSLDAKNFDAIGRAFEYLRKRFDTVFVVSHLEALKDIVDETIDITRNDDGTAHVEFP
jgi:DNA repair exonuclease SbcCD ATPase subunit/predicted phosphodiesterase